MLHSTMQIGLSNERGERDGIDVSSPPCISDYNSFMGGVDFADRIVKKENELCSKLSKMEPPCYLQLVGAVRTMKDKTPVSHVTVQIDYPENYTCSYGEEIQSAYYKEQITLHPMDVHCREQGDMTNYSTSDL